MSDISKIKDIIDSLASKKAFSGDIIDEIAEFRAEARKLEEEFGILQRENKDLVNENHAVRSELIDERNSNGALQSKIDDLEKQVKKMSELEAAAKVNSAVADTVKECFSLVFRNAEVHRRTMGSVPIADPAGGYVISHSTSSDETETVG